MIIPVYSNISTALFNQFRAKIFDLNPGVYLVFTERRLFTLAEMRHECGVIGNIQIAIFIAIVNVPITAMHLRAFRHIDTQKGLPVQLNNIHRKIRWRSKLQWVVDGSNKIFFDLRYSIWLNPLNSSIIQIAKQNRPAMSIEKGANRLINIAVNLIPAGFELRRDPFPLSVHVFAAC